MGGYRIHIYTGQTSKRGSTTTVMKEGYQAPGDAARRGEARESGSTANIAAAMLLRLLTIRSALERRRWTGGREPDVEGLRSSPSADTILQSSLGAPPPLELLYPELCSELLVVTLSRIVEFSSTSSSSESSCGGRGRGWVGGALIKERAYSRSRYIDSMAVATPSSCQGC